MVKKSKTDDSTETSIKSEPMDTDENKLQTKNKDGKIKNENDQTDVKSEENKTDAKGDVENEIKEVNNSNVDAVDKDSSSPKPKKTFHSFFGEYSRKFLELPKILVAVLYCEIYFVARPL